MNAKFVLRLTPSESMVNSSAASSEKTSWSRYLVLDWNAVGVINGYNYGSLTPMRWDISLTTMATPQVAALLRELQKCQLQAAIRLQL